MNRADAIRRVEALRQMTTARGCTPAEARVAATKVQRLERQFGLEHKTSRPPPRARRARRTPRAGYRGWRGGTIFDPLTGQAAEGVRVHYYKDRANWKIELPR